MSLEDTDYQPCCGGTHCISLFGIMQHCSTEEGLHRHAVRNTMSKDMLTVKHPATHLQTSDDCLELH